MKDSLSRARTADAKDHDSASPIHAVQPVREGPESDLNVMRKTVQRARCNGCGTSGEGIATELVGMRPAQRASALRGLQQTRGNRYVGRLAVQAKLKIGAPGDKYEQEADRVADEVMRMPEPQAVSSDTLSIQRTCAACEEENLRRQPIEEEDKEEFLQSKEVSGHGAETTRNLEDDIDSTFSSGQVLPKSSRAFFEPRFGQDFSHVRVHTDTKAAESARAINAKAFTVGRNIVFGAGQYAPGMSAGRRLLAHELTHIIQQQGRPSCSGEADLIQRLIDCDDQNTTVVPNGDVILTKAHELAVARITQALNAFNNPAQLQNLLNAHFRSPVFNPTSQANTERIRLRFARIQTRLNRGTIIYMCNSLTSRRCPGRRQAETDCGTMAGYTNICPVFFTQNPGAALPVVRPLEDRALILIHEAAHNAGACRDVYMGAGYPGRFPYHNAEAFAQFAMDPMLP